MSASFRICIAALLLLSCRIAAQEQGSDSKQDEPTSCDSLRSIQCQDQLKVCLPALVPDQQRCELVTTNAECVDGGSLLEYLPLLECGARPLPRWLTLAALALWALVLFYCLAVVAEAFLCVGVERLAAALALPHDVAGITLFAFATGAPDIFTQLAAVDKGEHVDVELAVSSTLGSGLFAICVVLAAVLLQTPEDGLRVADPRAYVRDALAYLASCALVVASLADNTLRAWEAGVMVCAYCAYLTAVIMTMRRDDVQFTPLPQSAPMGVELVQVSINSGSSSIGGDGGIPVVGALSPTPFGPGPPISPAGSAAVVPVVHDMGAGAGSGALDRRDVAAGSSSFGALMSRRSTSAVGAPTASGLLLQSTAASAGLGLGLDASPAEVITAPRRLPLSPEPNRVRPVSRPVSPATPAVKAAAAAAVMSAAAAHHPLAPTRPSGAIAAAASASVVAASAAAGTGAVGIGEVGLGQLPSYVARQAADLLHMGHRPAWLRPLALATAPLVLAMHATMPGIKGSQVSSSHSGSSGTAAPAGAGAGVGGHSPGGGSSHVAAGIGHAALPPQHHQQQQQQQQHLQHAHVSRAYAVLLSLCAPPLLLFSVGVSPVAGSGGGSPTWAALRWLLACALLSAALQLLQVLARRRDADCAVAGVPSRAGVLLYGGWAFCLSMSWMALLAGEVAGLFEAAGRAFPVAGEDALGATLLAWGETFPDLCSSLVLARSGNSAMVLAAVFAGPTLNLLVGTGGAVLMAAVSKGATALPAGITAGVAVLVVATAAALAFALLAPRYREWQLTRRMGWALLAGYALSVVVLLGVSSMASLGSAAEVAGRSLR